MMIKRNGTKYIFPSNYFFIKNKCLSIFNIVRIDSNLSKPMIIIFLYPANRHGGLEARQNNSVIWGQSFISGHRKIIYSIKISKVNILLVSCSFGKNVCTCCLIHWMQWTKIWIDYVLQICIGILRSGNILPFILFSQYNEEKKQYGKNEHSEHRKFKSW